MLLYKGFLEASGTLERSGILSSDQLESRVPVVTCTRESHRGSENNVTDTGSVCKHTHLLMRLERCQKAEGKSLKKSDPEPQYHAEKWSCAFRTMVFCSVMFLCQQRLATTVSVASISCVYFFLFDNESNVHVLKKATFPDYQPQPLA